MTMTRTEPMANRAASGLDKPDLGLLAIGNLSFGFLGIQIAFALQTSNVSRIFQILGASIDQLPLLWIAGPLTGLLVQPLVGYCSDRTWGAFGRRRPYFVVGAVLSAVSLVWLPASGALWLAVPAFWLLDISLNVTMEPFRAFVGDMLPERQRTTGYAVQTVFIGIGALAASAAPWTLHHVFGMTGHAASGGVSDSVRWSFYIGAVALAAAVLWTVVSTREYSPAQLASFEGEQPAAPAEGSPGESWGAALRGLAADIGHMPAGMRHLARVQFFSWCGLFILWIYATPSVAYRQFGGALAGSTAYDAAGDWVGVLFAAYNGVAAAYAFLIPALARRLGRERLHALNLLAGAAGLASLSWVTDPHWLFASMVGIGIAWASILTLPYALLCGSVPYAKFGLYMGVFNFFIVLPQLVVSGLMGPLVRGAFSANPAGVMMVAGLSLATGAALAWRRTTHE